jgi:hypothetical protein
MTDIEKPPYPLSDNLALVDEEAVKDYLDMLFQRVFWKPHHFVCIRGIGEKGTWQEGKFRSDEWVQPGLDEFPDEELAGTAMRHARTWAQWHVAAFIVPAVLKEARGTSQAVDLFTALVVDLDSGDTNAKAAWLDANIGTPSMVVASGGTTELGTPKLHVYYVLDEPEGDIAAVVEARHQLALKAGGDLQFGRGTPDNPLGRAHQPIRIPGTVHAKNGNAQASRLLFASGPLYDFQILAESIRRAPAGPWMVSDEPAPPPSGFLFGPTLNHHADMEAMLLESIQEGGEGKDTRWSRFNAVAGHYIALARKGEIGVDEAKARTYGWMLAQMVPPWPDARFDREWHGLVEHDRRSKGPMPAAAQPAAPPAPTVEELKAAPEKISVERRLENWAMHLWTQGEPPPREFLVDGLVLAGMPHLFVAEGGAGKTFAALDLCIKIASREEDEDTRWLGQRVRGAGTVVMLTTEDDKDELWRRAHTLDPDGRRFKAGKRLIVMPTLNSGGGFTMAERAKDGRTVPSRDWAELLAQLEMIPDLKLVVIDTLNSTLHGEENSATIINEYVRMIHPICGKLGAALLLTHHIRKQNNQAGGQNRPIASQEDMFNAIRGSSALPAAFRAVLGLWHSHDFGKRMRALGIEPKAKHLWRFGVLKANNPEMMDGMRFLLRNELGTLDDVTEQVRNASTNLEAQRAAWLVAAVKAAAAAGRPYLHGKKDAASGVYQRRSEMHPLLRERDFGRVKLAELVDELVADGELVVREVPWRDARGRAKLHPTLDVPDGQYATGQAPDVDPEAVYEAPDWEVEFEFDAEREVIVPVGTPRMAFGQKDA